jgi:hypothetical protein
MTAGSDNPGVTSEVGAVRALMSTVVVGQATQTGTDSDGNPTYHIRASSILSASDTVVKDDVTPDRSYEGVRVVQLRIPAKCIGLRSDGILGGWVWIVFGERLDWGECEQGGE